MKDSANVRDSSNKFGRIQNSYPKTQKFINSNIRSVQKMLMKIKNVTLRYQR